jgi:hypothetical protein
MFGEVALSFEAVIGRQIQPNLPLAQNSPKK